MMFFAIAGPVSVLIALTTLVAAFAHEAFCGPPRKEKGLCQPQRADRAANLSDSSLHQVAA